MLNKDDLYSDDNKEISKKGINFKKLLNKFISINEINLVFTLVIIILIVGIMHPNFLSFINIRSILKASSFTGIIIIGMAYSFIARQPDLSIGATAGMSAIISGTLIVRMGLPVWAGIIIAILVASLIGLFNGFLTVKIKVPPIIATLGMLFVIRGGAFLISRGVNIYPFPDSVIAFAKLKIFNLPISFIIFIVLMLLLDFILRRTVFGRKVYATGANTEVARIMGINTDFIKIFTHVQLAVLAAIAGILYMLNMGSGSPSIGMEWEFPIIAAVIIGGASILGGTGTVLGVFFGVILMQVIYNGLVFVGVNPRFEDVIIGLIMLVAATLDIWKRTRRT